MAQIGCYASGDGCTAGQWVKPVGEEVGFTEDKMLHITFFIFVLFVVFVRAGAEMPAALHTLVGPCLGCSSQELAVRYLAVAVHVHQIHQSDDLSKSGCVTDIR